MNIDDKLIITADVLPDVFVKVLNAKEMLSDGTAQNISEAVRMAGISRSVFYKYRGHVFRYIPEVSGTVLNFTASLADKAGVLSNVLSRLYDLGANIITVNQNQPVDSIALVSFSIRINNELTSYEHLKNEILKISGVKAVHRAV